MNWEVIENGFDKERIPLLGNKLSLGNGYMGYRGTLQEFTKSELVSCTISEIFDDNGNGWREPINMPNALYTLPQYNDKEISVLSTEIVFHVHKLSIDTGSQYRKTVFRLEDGKALTVEARQFASITRPHMLIMKYSVVADSDIDISIRTDIDEDVWNINGNHFESTEYYYEKDVSGLCVETIQDKHRIALAQLINVLEGDAKINKENLAVILNLSLKKNERCTFEKYIAICKDTDTSDVWQSAVNYCRESKDIGFDSILEEQYTSWKKRYDALGIRIKGDDRAKLAIYYSCYLLYSYAPEHTDNVAISARGLSGQVYKGAFFWDTEIYMLPMFSFCSPPIAKNLMMYRVKNLAGAYEKAKEYGYRGAFFPWESQEKGQDGCTHYNLTDIFTNRKMRTYFRDKQIHISADVVYGIWKYVEVTGDYSIITDGGDEVILECARFFNSFAYFKKDKDRFEFLDVTGADEYHERVNNDAYTNYMIWLTAKIALEVVEWLKVNEPKRYEYVLNHLNYHDEIDEVKQMYEKIYLPKPNDEGIIEQFDGYFKEEDLSIEELYSRIIEPNEYLGSPVGLAVNTQIIKQADVILMLSLMGDLFSKEIKEKNWEYYEPRTEHGSSLSACVYALLAARIGKTEWAYKFLLKTAELDLIGDYKQFLGSLYIGGTHPAANGGTWMVTVQGFGGLDIENDRIIINPHLPKHWEELGYSFIYKGYSCKVLIDKTTIRFTVENKDCEGIIVLIKGQEYHYTSKQEIIVSY